MLENIKIIDENIIVININGDFDKEKAEYIKEKTINIQNNFDYIINIKDLRNFNINLMNFMNKKMEELTSNGKNLMVINASIENKITMEILGVSSMYSLFNNEKEAIAEIKKRRIETKKSTISSKKTEIYKKNKDIEINGKVIISITAMILILLIGVNSLINEPEIIKDSNENGKKSNIKRTKNEADLNSFILKKSKLSLYEKRNLFSLEKDEKHIGKIKPIEIVEKEEKVIIESVVEEIVALPAEKNMEELIMQEIGKINISAIYKRGNKVKYFYTYENIKDSVESNGKIKINVDGKDYYVSILVADNNVSFSDDSGKVCLNKALRGVEY